MMFSAWLFFFIGHCFAAQSNSAIPYTVFPTLNSTSTNELDNVVWGKCSFERNASQATVADHCVANYSDGLVRTISSDKLHRERVVALVLSSMDLSSLKPFTGFINLQELYLDENEITTITAKVFNMLTSLEMLSLISNRISSIEKDALSSLLKLKSLYLHSNDLVAVSPHTFPLTIHHLMLDLNKITTIAADSFYNFRNLTNLTLKVNDIRTIGKNAFSNSGITNLEVRFQKLSQISFAFVDMKAIKFLDLKQNKISSFDVGTFGGCTSLTSLDLSHNLLSSIGPSSFLFTPNLKSLDLSYNLLTLIPNFAFANETSLTNLNLEYNDIAILQSEAFERPNRENVYWNLVGNNITCNSPELSSCKCAFDHTLYHKEGYYACSDCSVTSYPVLPSVIQDACIDDDKVCEYYDLNVNINPLHEDVAAKCKAKNEDDHSERYKLYYILSGSISVFVFIATLLFVGVSDRKAEPCMDFIRTLFLTLRIFDFMSDWAFFAIAVNNPEFRRSFEGEYGEEWYDPAYSISVLSCLCATALLLPDIDVYFMRMSFTTESKVLKRICTCCSAPNSSSLGKTVTIAVILLEDLPQITLASLYLSAVGVRTADDSVSVVSLLASILAFILNIAYLCQRQHSDAKDINNVASLQTTNVTTGNIYNHNDYAGYNAQNNLMPHHYYNNAYGQSTLTEPLM
eukprot:m.120271 g.120271  ORF g.120271 m.120271 type:complete len:686 (-) comp14352_c0_seq4:44-2101(-)